MSTTTSRPQAQRLTPAQAAERHAALADPDLTLIPEPHTPSEQMPFIVCPACEGHGFRANPSLDGITSSQMDEWYGDDHDARETFVREYTTRGGAYDVRCDECHGDRVVRAQCECEGCEEARRLAWEDAEIQRQEIAFGC